MLGIDIYERYQDVTDWGAVARHGVRFCWIKGSDGGVAFRTDPARRPDGMVAGARSVGIPVGLYHYAQFNPSPEVQADVLTGEVRRLGATGVPPALDLEDPFRANAAARDFARRFLLKLRANGFGSVALYANTSMLTGIGADTLDVPGLKIWAANYGPNNGRRNPLSYRGRVDVHQYTSVGRVPGITGNVDLNESLTDITEDDMPLSDEDVNRVAAAVWENIRPHLDPNSGYPPLPMWVWTVGANMGAWTAADKLQDGVDAEAVAQAVAAATASLREQIRADVLEVVGAENAAQADEIANRVADRLNGKRTTPPAA